MQTVEQNTGLRVDGYLEIGFGGFVNIIDALGGIRMCLPSAIKDHDSHLNLKKGCQTLSGTNALGYVRMRKADPRGDLGRVERQRQMLAAVAKKAASPAIGAEPGALLAASAPPTTRFDQARRGHVAVRDGLARPRDEEGLRRPGPHPDRSDRESRRVSTAARLRGAVGRREGEAMFSDIARGDTSKLAKYGK